MRESSATAMPTLASFWAVRLNSYEGRELAGRVQGRNVRIHGIKGALLTAVSWTSTRRER